MSGVIVFLQALLKPVWGRGRNPVLEGTTDPVAYEWLRLGVRAAIEGNREDARYYFVQAVRTDINYARAWLYLGGVADDPALTLSCLRKAAQLDPSNADAHAGIIWASEKLGMIQPLPLPPPVQERTAAQQTRTYEPVGEEQNGDDTRPYEIVRQEPTIEPQVVEQQPTIIPWGLAETLSRNATPVEEPIRSGQAPIPASEWEPFRTIAPEQTAAIAEPPQLAERRQFVTAPLSEPPEQPEWQPTANVPAATTNTEGQGKSESSGRLMRRGVRAAISGNRPRARYYFLKSIAADGQNTRAWLYLGGVADDPSTTMACMERVMSDEPHSAEAEQGMKWALAKLGVSGLAMRWWKT